MNYFIEAITKKYADFNGRARRSEYWYFALFWMIAYFVLAFIDYSIGTFPILLGIFYLATLVPLFAVTIRRMHDVGKSGWYMLIPIYSLILTLTDSEPNTNQYGPNPKNPEINIEDHLVS